MDSLKIAYSTVLIGFGLILDTFYFYLMLIYFDVDTIGIYSVLTSFFITFSFITSLGFTIAHLKFYPEAKNQIEQGSYNGAYLFISLIQYSCFIILMLILIPIVPLYDGDITVVYMFFLANLLRIENFVKPLFLIKKQVFKKGISTIITFSLRIFLIISFHDLFTTNIWFLIGIILISNIIFFIINIFWLRKIKIRKPSKILIKKYFIYTYPLFIISSFNIIFKDLDVLIVNLWVPVSDVANFYTAKRFYLIFFNIFTLSTSNILITTFSNNIIAGKNEYNYELMSKTHKFFNLVIIPLVFLIALYSSRFFVFILGEDYELAGINLSIIIFNLIPISINCVIPIQFKALGKTKIWALITVIQNIIGLLMLIILAAPVFLNLGIIGAALAIPLTGIIVELVFRPIYYKKYKIGFYWGLLRNFIIMLFIFLLQFYINEMFVYPIYYIPLFLLLDFGLYLLITYLLKGYSKKDIKFVLNIFSIKNLKEQVISEMKD